MNSVRRSLFVLIVVGLYVFMAGGPDCWAATYEVRPARADSDEEFERVANSLQPGDELVLQEGCADWTCRQSFHPGAGFQPHGPEGSVLRRRL